ncbi:hypothetical protein BU23DRAFT_51537 [Bimuria novae-zelandiae CBS 107.79]|uniref:EGF-like domain-containing protein n=1 Tax=Bimuria novae-zelandiae CBS 107.79 TaxID=1447943 RepID=A0A6A5UP57_9PLEO|nr:hypothetical protein BU23DRAFT_51537 [Bimuria novae-zelandiae CBS 107.79]
MGPHHYPTSPGLEQATHWCRYQRAGSLCGPAISEQRASCADGEIRPQCRCSSGWTAICQPPATVCAARAATVYGRAVCSGPSSAPGYSQPCFACRRLRCQLYCVSGELSAAHGAACVSFQCRGGTHRPL